MGQAKLRGNREQRISALFGEHSTKPLTRERYNAFVAWTRSPIAEMVGKEVDFYSTVDEHVLGVLVMDRTDRDYGYVSLGRDEKGRYRWRLCENVLAMYTGLGGCSLMSM